MARRAHENSSGGGNFYSQAKNNPEVLEKRQRVAAELDSRVQHILTHNPGRVPQWEQQRLMQMDRFCLQQGKRCVMWDDEGAGFYLMLNWDWLRNRPAQPATPEDSVKPGWWDNMKQLLRPPLLDPSIPEEHLAAWLDAHTMRVHGFLDKLSRLRRDAQTQQLVLEDPYWQELQQLPAWQSAPATGGGGDGGKPAAAAHASQPQA